MIRRLKEDVLKDLPPKTYCVIPVEIKRRKEYELAEADLVQWLLSQKKVRQANRAMSSERLVRIGYLKRLAAELKMDEVIKWIENFLEETGRKLIVFGIHKARIKELKERFGSKAVVVDGTVTGERRQQAVDAFNKNKKIRLFLGNVDAAGVGWSCKSASDVMFFEFPWVPGKLSQASDRIHGVGRGIAGRKAFIHFLVAHSTIEEKLVEVLQKKQIVLSKLFDGGSRDTDLNVLDLMEDALTKRNK